MNIVRIKTGTEIKLSHDDDDRKIDFAISTGSVDRDGDTINPKGWNLKHFLKNPVVLFGHDNRSLPIGKAENVRVEGDALKATVVFASAELNPLAESVFLMVRAGFLNATSVGFRPTRSKAGENGVAFLEQELLEFSIVPVPANPEALISAKGIDLSPVEDWYKQFMDDWKTNKSVSLISRTQMNKACDVIRKANRSFEVDDEKDTLPVELNSKKDLVAAVEKLLDGLDIEALNTNERFNKLEENFKELFVKMDNSVTAQNAQTEQLEETNADMIRISRAHGGGQKIKIISG